MKLIVEERGKQVTYELGPSETAVVGRGLENTVPIRDSQASRKHCQVVVEGGVARVEDLGSKNGTILNGKKLKAPTPLSPCDRIDIGETRIWFGERPAGAEPAAAPAKAAADVPLSSEDEEVAATGLAPETPPEEKPAAVPPAAAAPAGAAPPAAAPSVPPGRYTLEAVEGELSGQTFKVEALPWKIGRTKKNQLIVHDSNISGEHAEIVSRGEGLALVDLGSKNGTKVNGAKVKRAVLTDGSRIQVGGLVLVLHDAVKPAPEVAAGQPHPSEIVLAKQGGQVRAPAAKAARPGAPRTSDKAPAQKPAAPAPVSAPAAAPRPAPAPAPEAAPRRAPAAPEALPFEEEEDEDIAAIAAGVAEGDLGAAADALGRSATMAAIEEGARPTGAILAGILAVSVLAAAGYFLKVALAPAAESAADLDPPPRGNRIANWSFEEEPGPGGIPPRWSAREGTLSVDPVRPAGGARAGRLAPRGAALAEASSAAAIPAGGRDLQVRGQLRGGPAVLAVVWESAADPTFRLVSTSDVVEGGEWADVQATFHAPAGAERGRVAVLAAGETWIDRVAVSEREASTGRAAAARVAAEGLTARLDERGILELWRGDRPAFDAVGLVLRGEGPLAALARQDAAATPAPLQSKERRKRDPRVEKAAERAPRAAGSIALPDGRGRAKFVEEVDAAEGGIDVRWRLEGSPAVAPSISLYMEQAARADRFEVILAGGKDGGRVAPPFEREGVRELSFGGGAESVSLKLDPPLAVRASPLGRGLVLTLDAPAGAGEVGFVLSRGSAREVDAARLLFDEAEAAKRAGRLEEARRIYARIQRELAQDGAARERARRAEGALVARAESALAEAAAIEGDIAALGVEALLESAGARCRFVMEAYPETAAAARAQDLLRRVEEKRAKLVGVARIERAKELLALGKRHLERGRYRLARLYLSEVLSRFGDLREIASEAGREIDLAERQIGEGS